MNNYTFDQTTLDRLIQNRIGFYEVQESTHSTRGAVISIYADFPLALLQQLQAKLKEGYTLNESLPVHMTPTFCRVYLTKSAEDQAADIEAIKIEVEHEYKADLQRAYDAALAQLIEDAAQREAAIAAKKAAAAEEKARKLAEVDAVRLLGQRPE